jgi:CheY-like chemotaxis protein
VIAPVDAANQIMIVDRDQRMLHATARLAKLWGYPCDTSMHGGSALQASEEAAPALLIVHLSMPQLDGFEVIKGRGQIAPSSRIPAVSGDMGRGQHRDVSENCRALGPDTVPEKPITPGRLRAMLERLIGPPEQREMGLAQASESGRPSGNQGRQPPRLPIDARSGNSPAHADALDASPIRLGEAITPGAE